MKNLLLCSSFADIADQLTDFFAIIHAKSVQNVAFIEVASHVESYKDYIEQAKKAFQQHGIAIEIVDFSQSSDNMIHQLQRNDLIYISGGNTFYLLHMLNEKQLTKVIIDLIDNGKPYIGESAGAIILSKDIGYVKNIDDAEKAPNLANFKALDIIDFYPLPHFDNPPFRASAHQIVNEWQEKIPLMAFNNNQAIWVLGKSIILKNGQPHASF